MDDAVPAGVRIGELSRRVGVEPATLRAWERRYGLPRPGRSRAGQRLYDPAQELALRRMLALRAEGFAPQVAARLARGEAAGVRAARRPAPAAGPPALERGAGGAAAAAGSAAALEAALDALDSRAAHAALDHLLAARGLDLTLRDVVLPLLARIGDRWEAGELSVGQEHFASALLGGRLRALGRSFALRSRAAGGPGLPTRGAPRARPALLRAAPARPRLEVTFLGADTPLEALTETAARIGADLVVLGRRDPGHARRRGAGAGGRDAAARPRRPGRHARRRGAGAGPPAAGGRRRGRRRALRAARRRLSRRGGRLRASRA